MEEYRNAKAQEEAAHVAWEEAANKVMNLKNDLENKV